jgi:hypothetical protein
MKLDLCDKQCQTLRKGKSIQLKHEQIGRGFNVNLHPMNEKKIMKAYKANKGVRVHLTGNEIGDMEGGKFSVNRTMKDIGIKRKVNRTIKKTAPVVRTINRGLKSAGLDSLQEMAINQAVDMLPIPTVAKTSISKAISKRADKAIAGAGFKGGKVANPYLPTAFMRGEGFSNGGSFRNYNKIRGGSIGDGTKTFDDQRNILRSGQAGFVADVRFDPMHNPHLFDGKPKRGAGFRN